MPGAVMALHGGRGRVHQAALSPPGGRHPGGCRQVLYPAVEEAAPGAGASLGWCPAPPDPQAHPRGHPRFQVQLLGEGGRSCVKNSSAGGTSSPDAWAQLHQPPSLARRGVPSSRAGQENAWPPAVAPGRLLGGRVDLPPLNSHSQFTKRVHRRAPWSLGRAEVSGS